MAIRKLLVANRGEIAARVFRTCRRLGIGTVAVHAPDDEGASHTRQADEAVPVAGYLSAEALVRAAQETGADAVHPGYGFLAENGEFAEAVGAAGLVFVGPPPEAIRAAGDKLEAKRPSRGAPPPRSTRACARRWERRRSRSRARSATRTRAPPSSC